MERRILILSAGAFFAVLLAGAFFQPGMLGLGRAAPDDLATTAPSLAAGLQDAAPGDVVDSAAYGDDDDDGHEDGHHDEEDYHDDHDEDDEYEDDD